ncbi:MAG: hypothetical protein KME50_34035 [Nostoc desertorum CM1-VF14]|nr:hypothetical protein [Nostoc desertorum CM1-VF14]
MGIEKIHSTLSVDGANGVARLIAPTTAATIAYTSFRLIPQPTIHTPGIALLTPLMI